jgi:hypothetical protein
MLISLFLFETPIINEPILIYGLNVDQIPLISFMTYYGFCGYHRHIVEHVQPKNILIVFHKFV